MTSLISNLTGRKLAAVVGDLLDTLPWWSTRRDAKGGGPVRAADLVRTVEALLSRRGEASGVVLARLVLDGYRACDPEQKTAFLMALAEFFGIDEAALAAAAAAYVEDRSPEAARRLRDASRPRNLEVLRRLNLAPGGARALVRMREDLMDRLRDQPRLAALDDDFARLFSTWFNRGFLTLGHIDWNTPAAILEKIIRYEAVHVIEGWDDLRNRLAPTDRRCFAFFHPSLPDEPLIFVEVALTTAIPDAIAPLLDLTRAPIEPERASVAVFYSISNTQRGLAGVSFGNFLIKQVVEDLRHELPHLSTFVTLSPAPGFAKWLARERADEASRFLSAADRAALTALDAPDWHHDPAKVEAVRGPLIAAAARYFLVARREKGGLVDPVARFHLGNGARLERLNFLGDRSPQGLAQSHGLMVNYLYDLDEIERHHEEFFEHDRVAASSAVAKLAEG
ncbi:MAG: malonyl-CoA decarboxylase [Hyphomicrobiales bacterium]|nr:malonyl-CoA decarboxylase [Hyphomicrobiales bacterium]